MTISVAEAGEYVEATDLYTSKDGEWVHVPMGEPEWTRPAEWLDTDVAVGQQKMQLLLHLGGVSSTQGERAMTVWCQGAYTVDWGDGTAPQNVATGVTATHLYNPAVLGPPTSDGKYQAMVTITPQSGQTLTALNLAQGYYTGRLWKAPVVEMVVGPSLTSLVLTTCCPYLKRIEFKSPLVMASGSGLFASCVDLREIIGTVNITGTTAATMFNFCYMLTKFPTLVTPNLTTANSMFNGCTSMHTAPMFDHALVTNWSAAFATCTALKNVPPYNTAAATNLSNLFSQCYLLEEIPEFDLAACTLANGFFVSCPSLREVSLVNTGAVQNASQMFNGCSLLHTIAPLDLSGATSVANLSNIFAGCPSLRNLSFLAGKGPLFSFSIASTMLDPPTLDALYTVLPVVTGQTLTVTSAFGGLADNPAIATAKGWTVTGS